MRPIFRRMLGFCSLLLPLLLPGQNLLQDAQELATNLAILQRQQAPPDQREQALSQTLAILAYYGTDPSGIDPRPATPEAIQALYQRNGKLSAYVQQLGPALPQVNPLDLQPYLQAFDTSRQARQVLDLLYNSDYRTPADYLSMVKTLQDYQEPPVSGIQALQATATSAPSQASTSLLNERAVILGLFSFLIERAGEEVVITYLQRLLGRDIKYLEVLFPTVINSYGNYNFAYSTSFLASLREAFYVDLQLLDLRLAELLSDPDFFGELQADPVFYNIMAVYVLSSLVQQEVPVVEAIPVVHNFLYQRYADDDKARNLQIVNTATDKPAYAEVVAASEAVLKELTAAYLSLYRAEEALLPRYQLVTATAFMRNEKLDLPPFDQFFDQEKYSLAALLGVAEDPQPYDLTYLPSLLKGRLDTTIAAGLTTVADYDQFYGSQIVPTEWRAAGLAMARRLTGEWYNHTSLGQLLRQQREALIQYDALLLKAEERVGITDPMQAQTERVEQGLQQLSASLQATADYWSEVLTADDEQAFQLLQKLATDFRLIEDDPFANPSDVLSQKTQRLAAVEERFFALNGRIAARGDSVAGINPIRLYRERPATPLPGQLVRIEALETRLQELSESLENLDAAYAPNLSAGRRNAEPILKVTELLSLAFYGLQDQSADQSLITIGRFDTLLRDPLQRTAILGLLEQQLSFSRIGGGISSEGLGLFARTTLEELAAIPPKGTPARDSLGGYYLAAFATHTLNRTLQMPLFANPLNPGRTQSLVNIYPDLADVPSATENTLDVIYNLKTKNHRRALSSFLLLMQDLTAMLDDPDGSPQREKVIDFIRQYGMFIGGLVDADRPEEVQYLLQTMADPPGSSQVKRREPFTANINGYVGISLGQERLRGSALATDPAFATLAPAMPVGVSFSRLIGYDRWKYPQSFSLFFSVLDLGALATFNLDQELPGENELRFQNVLKPGVQLHWNLRNSPFYLGVGGQYGPQYRQINGELTELQSVRYFVAFGVDVVIKRLY